jgi:hypothetical protein
VAAQPGLTEAVLAHGGVLGAIAEAAIALAVVGLFVGIWLRERSARKADDGLTEPDRDSER